MHELSASSDPRRGPVLAAVIVHADDAGLLRRCIAHHLEIGVDHIFVSLNLDDAESDEVVAEFAPRGVRAERVAAFAPDPFDYFTAAMKLVVEWVTPDWILFVDSDEFWLPASGQLRHTANMDSADVYSVRRFNVPPIRGSDGAIREFAISDPERTLLIAARQVMDADFLTQHPEMIWINARIGPKLMVRPQFVEAIGVGAHDFAPRVSGARKVVPHDLMIVHVPFTTEARFRRKVASIRARMETYGHRYRPGEGWHWRRWLAVDDAGGTADEFGAQFLDEAATPELLARGTLTTPARLFAGGLSTCE